MTDKNDIFKSGAQGDFIRRENCPFQTDFRADRVAVKPARHRSFWSHFAQGCKKARQFFMATRRKCRLRPFDPPLCTHQAERPDRHARCASTMFGEVQHAAMGKTAAKDVAEEGGH